MDENKIDGAGIIAAHGVDFDHVEEWMDAADPVALILAAVDATGLSPGQVASFNAHLNALLRAYGETNLEITY